ncbi:MAG: hypothetical protein EP330_29260 [Deltaproteobacteria bacterium]|nr:MAG: hypothetical protein EP330_29260 [Deltaproteobacteria bacterium]
MPKLTDLLGRPHSGIVPTAVIGIVKDNKDPDKLGRVQVTFPTLYISGGNENAVSFWLRVLSPDAGSAVDSLDGKGHQAIDVGAKKGSGRGFYAVPEIDDEVLVLFTQGSQDVGIVIGQLYNGADSPPHEADGTMPTSSKLWDGGSKSTDTFTDGSGNYDKNDRRLWKSRSGSLIVFDDTAGSESVQIWDSDQNLALVFSTPDQRIILSNSKGDIHIRTAKDLYLEAGENIYWQAGTNLEGEAGADIIEKAGANYTFEAGANGEMKMGANFDMEAGANLTSKAGAMGTWEAGANGTYKAGAVGSFQGGAMAELKGPMVKIN